LFAALLGNKAAAQTNLSITGSWKVVNLTATDDKLSTENKEKFETLRKLFFNSSFHFAAGNRFDYKILEPELEVKDARWAFNEKTGTYQINEQKNNALVMEIKVTQTADKVLFTVTEVPFVFEVVKF
jgi:hypothetical protein